MHSYQGPPPSASSLPGTTSSRIQDGLLQQIRQVGVYTTQAPQRVKHNGHYSSSASSSSDTASSVSAKSTLANQQVPNTASTQGLITGPLIPRVRAILASERGELCDEISPVTYKPIQPDQLPLNAQLPAIEPGRVEICVASLQSKLCEIE
mmetsp:Transcript_2483/g.3481  ORF Transcript_2483/g.3481 Transcript_2483/m.3481 type:complete len:151 (+) Transcript_2483:51-503(+)